MNVKEMEEMVSAYQGRPRETEASKEQQLEHAPKIVIDPMVFQKVNHWVMKTDIEVSGLGKVKYDAETNTLHVIDAIMLPQKNTSTTTELDGAAIGKAMFLLRNTPGDLRWWWHSHADMPVFWSGTDIDTIKQLGGGGWFCATVFNRRQQVKSAFCQKGPVGLLLPDIPTQMYVSKELTAEWDAEFEKNVENLQHSFRDSRYDDSQVEREWEKYIQEREEEAQEVVEEGNDKELYEEVKTMEGNTIRFMRKKNIVPVPKKNPNETTPTNINIKTGQIEMADLASEDELVKWNHSISDDSDSEEEVLTNEDIIDEALSQLAVDDFIKRNS